MRQSSRGDSSAGEGRRAAVTFMACGSIARPAGRYGWICCLAAAIRATNARPAGVRLALELGRQGAATLSVAATAALDRPRADARLFVAVVETPIVAPIGAGENAGRILTHAHVVRRLLGPIELPAGKASSRWTLPIEPGWTANRLGVAAFVQDQGSGEVLQALARPPCPEG